VQEVIHLVMDAQAAAGPGQPAGRVQFASGGDLIFTAPVTLAELRRMKRAFLKAATSGMGYRLPAGDPATRVFVEHLRSNCASSLL
jgi:protein KTI12